jgi:flavin-binding protein dodecin
LSISSTKQSTKSLAIKAKEHIMAEHSIYKVVEIIGTNKESWEDAARSALLAASQSLRDLRVAEVKQFDLKLEEGQVVFRTKLDVSFKVEGHEV